MCSIFQPKDIDFLVGLKDKMLPVPVAHSCNPGYSGGKDQEDGDLKK
jgi:hypothetical protein